MTERELRQWMQWEGLVDRWYVREADGSLLGPQHLAELFAYREDRQGSLTILHDSQHGAREPAWVELDLASELDARARAELAQPRRRRRLRIIWQLLGLLAVGAALAYAYWRPQLEEAVAEYVPPERSKEEVMLERLAEVREAGGLARSSDYQPPIRAVIAKTDKVIYITNAGNNVWRQFTLTINDRFRFQPPDARTEIPPAFTLAIPLRQFLDPDTGERLDRSGQLPERIDVEAAGLRPLGDRF